jgi:hypothetical protein
MGNRGIGKWGMELGEGGREKLITDNSRWEPVVDLNHYASSLGKTL